MVKEEKKREEKGIEEELRKYRLIVESAQDAIFVKDLDSHYLLVNQKCLEAFGKSKQEEVLGKRDDELLPPEQAKINIEHDQQVFKTGRPKEVTKKMTVGGKERWFQAIKVPLRDAQGKIIGLISIARDITERKKAEEVLRESDEKLRYIIDNTWDIIFRIDMEGNYTFGNKAAEKITGYPIDKLLRMNMYELVAPEYHQSLRERIKKRIAGELLKQPFDFEIVRKDGHRITMELTTTEIRDKNRKLVGIQGIARDITERKKAEEELRQSEKRFRTFLDGLDDLAYETDSNGNTTYANKASEKITGLPLKDIIGKPFLPIFTEESQKIAIDVYKRTLNGESPEYELTFRNGKICRFKNKPIKDRGDKIVGVFGIARDITERKKMEEEIRDSQRNIEILINSSSDLIFLKDKNFRYLIVNESIGKFYNRKIKDIIGKTNFDFMPKEAAEGCRKSDEEALKSEGPIRREEYVGDRCFHVIKQKVVDTKGNVIGIAAVIRDITERKKAEEILRKSKDKYRTLVENLPQKIFLKDKNSVYVSCNDNLARDFKIKSGEIVGKTDYDLVPKELAEKYRADDKRIMESGETEDIEEKYIQEGQEVIIHTVKTPIKDEEGNIIGLLGIFWDITEHKKMEEEIRVSAQAIEGAYDAFVITDRDWKIIFANHSVLDMYGYHRDELMTKHVSVFSPESELKKQKEAIREAETRGSWSGELINKRKNGKEFPIILSLSLIKNEKNEVVGALSIFRDIAETKKLISDLEKAKVELTAKIEDLERFERVTVDRELKMIELKKKIEELEKQLKMSGNKSVEER